MGCDIHIYVEKRDGDGNWQPVERPYYNEKWDWRGWAPWDREGGIPDPGQRNYDVFAFLADVRNEGNIEPQFADRGIPDDTSYSEAGYNEWTQELDYGGVDSARHYLGDHSFTWAALDELLAAPWDATVKETGGVDPSGYAQWKENGSPEWWFGHAGGTFIADHAEFELVVGKAVAAFPWTRVSWEWQPLAGCDFRRWCETFLRELAGDDLSSVRVVIGFDS